MLTPLFNVTFSTYSGAVVMVPLFVNEGINIRVNTTEGTYVERAL